MISQAIYLYSLVSKYIAQPLGAPPLPLARALLTVALPLANPTPLPLTVLLLNMGAFLRKVSTYQLDAT